MIIRFIALLQGLGYDPTAYYDSNIPDLQNHVGDTCGLTDKRVILETKS